jgi:N-acylglucosamine 2-epimerase
MITLNVIQELRRFETRPEDDARIDECIRIMLDLHARPERQAVLEVVSWDGSELPGSMGRWINPGHMIEGGTFLVHEGQHRGRDEWVQEGVNWIDWGFRRGWDKEFGGIYNDMDLEGLPVPSVLAALRYDSKLWWQHAEALYALLLAYTITGETRFMDAYRQVHDYSFARFADPEYGEWFAVLDRRGNPIGRAKGTDRKSCFHIGRNFLQCALLADGCLQGRQTD